MWPSKSLPRRSRPLRRQTEGNGVPVGFSSIIYHLADNKRRPAWGAARAGWVVRAPLRRIPSHVGREPILARPPAGTAGASHLGIVLSGLAAVGDRVGALRCARRVLAGTEMGPQRGRRIGHAFPAPRWRCLDPGCGGAAFRISASDSPLGVLHPSRLGGCLRSVLCHAGGKFCSLGEHLRLAEVDCYRVPSALQPDEFPLRQG